MSAPSPSLSLSLSLSRWSVPVTEPEPEPEPVTVAATVSVASVRPRPRPRPIPILAGPRMAFPRATARWIGRSVRRVRTGARSWTRGDHRYTPRVLLTLLIAFSAAFVVTHLALSHGSLRANLVTTLGPFRFRLLYSFVAIGTFLPAAVIAWTERHLGPVLWDLPAWIELVVGLPLMLVAFVLLVLALATPSPVSMIPGRLEPRGVLRITRHPMNMGLALFGLVHLIGNGSLGDVAFFSTFVLVGVLGAFHQDARFAKDRGAAFADFRRRTSVLPVGAILLGRTSFEPSELPWPMVAIAVLAWAAIAVFHGDLFGAPLLTLPW